MKRARAGAIIAMAMLVTALPAYGPASATLKVPGNGPFGGEVTGFGISPHDPDLFLAATVHGIFRSQNGGDIWTRASRSRSGIISGFLFHPVKPNVVYSQPSGYRSLDGGRTWSAGLYPPFGRSVGLGLGFSNDGRNLFSAGLVRAVRSRDQGRTWSQIWAQPGLAYQLCGFAVKGGGRGTVYLAAPYRRADGEADVWLLRSSDGGRTWARRSIGSCPLEIVVSPQDPDHVFLLRKEKFGSSAFQVDRSRDGGRSWETLDMPLDAIWQFEPAASDEDEFYAMGSTDESPYETAVVGSSDGGRSWETRWSAHVYGTHHGMFPMAVHPRAEKVLLLGGLDGVRRSDDGARSFSARNQGLSATTPHTIALSPAAPGVLFTTTGRGIYRSMDIGESWTDIGTFVEPAPSFWSPWVRTVAVDAMGHVYASYMPADGVAVEDTQVFRSTDQGESWERVADVGAHQLLAHPTLPGVMLAATYKGLFVTRDAGASWTQTSVPASPVVDLHRDETTGSIYALSGDYRSSSPSGPALYRSDDFGTSWSSLTPPPLAGATTVAARGAALYVGGDVDEIARSTDGGKTWTASGFVVGYAQLPDIFDLALDPLDPQRVFASSRSIFGGLGVLESRDGGEMWTPVDRNALTATGALEFSPASLLSTGPLADRPLFAGMGGVWRVVPGPNPRHPAEIAGEVKAGRVVTCETGEWARTESVTYVWFSGSGAQQRRIEGADQKSFEVPRPTRDLFEIWCRATGEGPGGRYRTHSSVHHIRA